MKAFWWFRENDIAGMARPGFNGSHWFDLTFDEAVLVGWLGHLNGGSGKLSDFHKHLHGYGRAISKFYKLGDDEFENVAASYQTAEGVLNGLEKVRARTKTLSDFSVENGEVRFEICPERLGYEVDFLKKNGIETVVTLNEYHHSADVLKDNFNAHHISILDLHAPSIEQVIQFAEILKEKKKMVVHCLAGIGRTSTMLIAGHVALGESVDDLVATISKQNPTFILTGSQGEFINSVSEALKK